MLGEFAAFLAELDHRDLVFVFAGGAVFFFDLPFDRQAVTVPAGDIVGILAHHLLGSHDHVFEDFVQRMTDVQMTVGVGRTVVQHELFTALARLAALRIKVHGFPTRQGFRFALRQSGTHGELGLGQEHCVFVVRTHGFRLTHQGL